MNYKKGQMMTQLETTSLRNQAVPPMSRQKHAMPMTRRSLQGILHPRLHSSRSLGVILLDERLEDLQESGILERVQPGQGGAIPNPCHDPGTFHGPYEYSPGL